MKEIVLSEPCSHLDVPGLVASVGADLGLEVQALTLRKYPGCTHWHLRKAGFRGTLEITWWPEKDKVWISLREDRDGDWIEEAVEQLVRDFG